MSKKTIHQDESKKIRATTTVSKSNKTKREASTFLDKLITQKKAFPQIELDDQKNISSPNSNDLSYSNNISYSY